MTAVEQIDYLSFEPGEHLPGVLALCEAQGWRDLCSDPVLVRRSLTAPGLSTVVAVRNERVVGFPQIQGDGVLQAHLSLIAVDGSRRRKGVGRRLVEEAVRRSGARRVDLISTAGAEGFYESFPHKRRSGYRIYPGKREEAS